MSYSTTITGFEIVFNMYSGNQRSAKIQLLESVFRRNFVAIMRILGKPATAALNYPAPNHSFSILFKGYKNLQQTIIIIPVHKTKTPGE
jgi:hypothetical protein